MFSASMISRALTLAAVLVAVVSAACEKVPLLAPSGSSITLTASINALPATGSVEIVAHVIEASGTPPHSGTRVFFTTTLGRIEPAEAETDVSGRAVARFVASGSNGTATISASSGGANTGTNGALRISVGSASVGRVIVNASPATVPATGGNTTITANVLDVNGNILSGTPVSFSANAGSLTAAIVTTDANGVATTRLTTSQTTTVTASVGATGGSNGGGTTPPPSTGNGNGTDTPTTPSGPTSSGQASGTVTVNVTAAPSIVITLPATLPSVGVPAIYTFNVTAAAQNGSAITDFTIDWGDGDRRSFGAVTGALPISHVYSAAGTFLITATATDAAGNRTPTASAVTVIPVSRPTIQITKSPTNPEVGDEVTFSIQVTTTPGIGVQNVTVNFGDGTAPEEIGGATSATVTHTYAVANTYTVQVFVVDTTGQTTRGTTTVTVAP